MKTPARLTIAGILYWIGFAVSLFQVYSFHALRSGNAGLNSICNVNSLVNCEAVEMSSYAELISGIPLAAFAGGWLLAMAILALVARNAFWRRDVLKALLVFNFVGALFSVVYMGIMFFELKALCLYCLVVDAVLLGGMGLLISLRKEAVGPLDRARLKTFTWVAGASLASVILFSFVMKPKPFTASEIKIVVDDILSKKPVSVSGDGDYATFGPEPEKAKITIVKFSDFQCPACQKGAFSVHPILEKYRDQVRFVFRNFPLNSACNRKVQTAMHAYACEAALVGICSHRQGKFKKVYSSIFENQEKLKPGYAEQLAIAAGVNAEELRSCVASESARAALSRDVEEGILLDVRSTPTFFINGYKVEGSLPPEIWERLIERLLKP